MARQNGINEITGTIGNFTYFKSKEGYLVKRKSSLTREQFFSNERMAVCRDYSNEFKNASDAGQLIRNSIRPLLILGKDTYHVSRLFKVLKIILNMDEINIRGKRHVMNGDMTILKGFNFNEDCKLNECFYGIFKTNHSKKTGEYNFMIQPFEPIDSFKSIEGVIHYKFISIYSQLNFYENNFKQSIVETPFMRFEKRKTQDILFQHVLEKDTLLPTIGILGIQFFREVNGKKYIVQDRQFNPVAIVDVI